MEHLADLINSEVALGNWTGVKTSKDGPTFTHLFFADDLILFAKATKKIAPPSKEFLTPSATVLAKKLILANGNSFSHLTRAPRISPPLNMS